MKNASLVLASQCRLYMGPSSLSTEDEPKLGLYAGVDYDKDDFVGYPEVAIPLVDFTDSWNRETELSDDVMEFIEGYIWTAEYAGSKWEGNFTSTLAVPGIGVLANYHSGTHNVDWLQGSALIGKGSLFHPGESHPARGAITNHDNMTMRASRPIKKGEEIFANFGQVWDGNGTVDDVYGDKLTRWDYEEADKIIDRVLEFMVKHEDELTDELKDEVLDFILFKVLRAAAGSHAKVIRSLIPANPGKLQKVKDMGGTFAYRNPDLIKSQKWLQKHAVCVDNLESKTSTISNAGRGAFATRDIKTGGIIAPVPTLHIADDELLQMFDIIQVEDEEGKKSDIYDKNKSRGQQLLLNYCFGHPESSLLLFPISPVVTQINHAPPEKANARLSWSNNLFWGNSPDLQDLTPEELSQYHHVGITLELYALRDIEQGDEVFIDYGFLWEEAWNDYMQNYEKVDWPIKAYDLKGEYVEKPYKTKAERERKPYPKGVQTACFIIEEDMPDGLRNVNEKGDDIVLFSGPKKFEEFTGNKMYMCDIIDRESSKDFLYNYTVIAINEEVDTQVMDVPHFAITFIDLPYTSDLHQANAFRHPIGIPDVIFPQAWRDKR